MNRLLVDTHAGDAAAAAARGRSASRVHAPRRIARRRADRFAPACPRHRPPTSSRRRRRTRRRPRPRSAECDLAPAAGSAPATRGRRRRGPASSVGRTPSWPRESRCHRPRAPGDRRRRLPSARAAIGSDGKVRNATRPASSSVISRTSAKWRVASPPPMSRTPSGTVSETPYPFGAGSRPTSRQAAPPCAAGVRTRDRARPWCRRSTASRHRGNWRRRRPAADPGGRRRTRPRTHAGPAGRGAAERPAPPRRASRPSASHSTSSGQT